jgi:hypothetical protein
MSDYQEEVARMRMQRKQEEAAAEYEQARQQYNQAVEARENAALQFMDDPDGARADWNYYDSEVEAAERALAPFMRPPPPDPRAVKWDAQTASYQNQVMQRVGPERAMQGMAHVSALAARHFPPNSPGHIKFCEDYLEMYSEDATGVKFDPKDKILDPNEAASISGLSPNEYNASVNSLMRQGRIRRG